LSGAPSTVEIAAARARARLTPGELHAVDDCNAALGLIRPEGEPVLEDVAALLKDLLTADLAGLYAVKRVDWGWQAALCNLRGLPSGVDGKAFVESWFNGRSAPLHATTAVAVRRVFEGPFAPVYNPERPNRRQRNRAVRPAALTYHENHDKIVGHDQLRVLVCDGPALLAWVGAVRSVPFSAREHRRLDALVPALQRHLVVERRLRDAGLQRAGLVAALEALAAPAFVVRTNGSVAHANRNGRAAYDRDPSLRRALLRGAPPGFEATEVAVRGEPAARLLLQSAAHGELEARVAESARAWRLTRRETGVLGLLVSGDSNGLIAVKLGCSVRTVELHVTKILRKAQCEGRSDVIRRALDLG
jgi:DNA-binding CsgD family transcriptional regulator